MGTSYPSGLDNFAEASPSNLGDSDTSGRTHSERHDDVEAAVEQIEETLGTLPQGSDSTVRDRIAGAESDAAAALTAFNTHTHASTPPALAASGGTLTGALLLPDGAVGTPSLANADDPNTGILFPAADTVAVSTGGTERVRVDSAGLITGSGTSLGAWTAYTPQVDQGVTTDIAKTVGYARYVQIGKLVFCQGRLSLTAGGTAGSEVTVTLPVTANLVAARRIGSGEINDATVNGYSCEVVLRSATQISFLRSDAPRYQSWGIDPNVALASGDAIYYSVIFEAA